MNQIQQEKKKSVNSKARKAAAAHSLQSEDAVSVNLNRKGTTGGASSASQQNEVVPCGSLGPQCGWMLLSCCLCKLGAAASSSCSLSIIESKDGKTRECARR